MRCLDSAFRTSSLPNLLPVEGRLQVAAPVEVDGYNRLGLYRDVQELGLLRLSKNVGILFSEEESAFRRGIPVLAMPTSEAGFCAVLL